jgi:tetratricopeptide (TPR) repeat protein
LILPTIASALGAACALSGRLSDAVTLLEQARDGTAGRLLGSQAFLAAQLGETYLAVGRADDARAATTQALELARQRSERGTEAWVLRLWGEIHAAQEPPNVELAESTYAAAIGRAEELGMRPLVAHCHLGLGKLHRHTGKREQAREHLTTATTMYREMDMRFWLEQAEATIRELQ